MEDSTQSAPSIENEYSAYFTLIGHVVYQWNHLQERIGLIFSTIVAGRTPNLALSKILQSVWHSQQSDRNQRRMLRAAIQQNALFPWLDRIPSSAIDDLLWLLKQADELSGRRDEAIHAPIAAHSVNGEYKALIPLTFNGNQMALRLHGKDLLEELSLSKWRAEILSGYAIDILAALLFSDSPWPNKHPSLSRELHRQPLESNLPNNSR